MGLRAACAILRIRCPLMRMAPSAVIMVTPSSRLAAGARQVAGCSHAPMQQACAVLTAEAEISAGQRALQSIQSAELKHSEPAHRLSDIRVRRLVWTRRRVHRILLLCHRVLKFQS
eukprot:COSAG01_NODE_2702_length_7228_cov_4.014869_1_plen_116_part_00